MRVAEIKCIPTFLSLDVIYILHIIPEKIYHIHLTKGMLFFKSKLQSIKQVVEATFSCIRQQIKPRISSKGMS